MRDPTFQILTTIAVVGGTLWLVARTARPAAERMAEGVPAPRRNAIGAGLLGASALLLGGLVTLRVLLGRAGCDAPERPPFRWALLAACAAWLLALFARPIAASRTIRGLAALEIYAGGALVALLLLALTLPMEPPGRLEARVIGDIRTVISAEEAFRTETGAYGDLECLTGPSSCLPGYTGPTFLDESFRAPLRGRYNWAFRRARDSYRITAVPFSREPGTCCTFCGDSTGRVCFRRGATAWAAADECGSDCQELESHQH
jgi:hypothetical protein